MSNNKKKSNYTGFKSIHIHAHFFAIFQASVTLVFLFRFS